MVWQQIRPVMSEGYSTSGGQGMAIAANRFKGIRACVGSNQDTVRDARNDNDCNVLCLPAHSLDFQQVVGKYRPGS